MTSFNTRAVEDEIAATEFAGHVLHLTTVASTNDLALAAAHSGVRHGVWIAEEQTAGRGRGAHTWHSAPGEGLYMTALIAPAIPMQSTLRLSFATAIAVQSAIASVTGLKLREQIDIRWPNDLTIPQPTGPSRKVGGILIETAAHPAPASGPAMLRYAVIGIGINLNHLTFPPELDAIATSLRRELPNRPLLPCEPLAAHILIALDEEIRCMTANVQSIHTAEEHSSWITGKQVRVEPRDGVPGYTGVTAGLDPSGFLRVTGDDGQLHTVLSGGLREP